MLIAIVSLLFFGVGAIGLSYLSPVVALSRDTAFLLDVLLSVAFFQLFAHRFITWRSVSHDGAIDTPTSA
ncbi:MAG TPA: hypothetical protein VFF44_05740 [Casimicrobiaceae bacterium]|nr:hypothetical protein [Casimicrobiaceae bacterium]